MPKKEEKIVPEISKASDEKKEVKEIKETKVEKPKKEEKKTIEGHIILNESEVNGRFIINTEDGLGYSLSEEEYKYLVK